MIYALTNLLQSRIAYLVIAAAGAVVAWRITRPPQLRWLKIFQVVLLPVLFWALFRGAAGLSFGALHPLVAIALLLSAVASLLLTLTPNLVWLFQSARLDSLIAPRRKPQLLDDRHMQPIRQLIEGHKFAEACGRFELLLRSHRGDFPQIQLLTQLYHQLKRNQKAEKCALQMIGLARNISEQLTAMHFYHDLAGNKPKPTTPKPAAPQGAASAINTPAASATQQTATPAQATVSPVTSPGK